LLVNTAILVCARSSLFRIDS